MSETRNQRDDEPQSLGSPHGVVLQSGETLRTAASSFRPPVNKGKKRDRLSVIWRLFGGTLLSIAALVCITLYQQITNAFTELRTNVNRLNETRSELVKNEDFNNRMKSVWTSIRDLQAAGVLVSTLKDKSTWLEQEAKRGEEERKELTRELQQLRERQAALEARLSATPKP
jgi:hypothetical protein